MKKLISLIIVAVMILSTGAYAANKTITAYLGVGCTLVKTDFNFGVGDKIIITSTPNNGALAVPGVGITSGAELYASDFPKLTYTADSKGNDSFTYKYLVRAIEPAGAGGEEGNWNEETISITVTDARVPTVTGFTVTASGQQLTYAFSANNFSYTKNDGGALDFITITGAPTLGQLILTGSKALNIGDEVKAADLGKIVYEASTNLTGNTDSFKFIATGKDKPAGVTMESNEATVSITIDRTVKAPTLSNITVSTTATAAAYEFQLNDFQRGYKDDYGDSPASITITTLPSSSAGKLRYNNSDISSSSLPYEIKASDIGNLKFTLGTNLSTSPSFKWSAKNSQGVSGSAVTCTINISYTLEAGSFSKSVNRNTRLSFTQKDFTDNFTGSSSSSSLYDIQITSLPDSTYGTLYNGNTAVKVDDVIHSSSLSSLRFDASNTTGTTTFRYKARESSSGTYSSNGTVTIVVGYSLSPGDFTKTIGSNSTLTFASSDFENACTTSSSSATIANIRIVSLPSSSRGTLYYNGNAVAVNDTFSLSRANNLTFTSKSSTGTATFTYKISDTSASSSYSSSTGTVTITIGRSLSPGDFSKSVASNSTLTFALSDFENVCTTSSSSESIANIRIVSLPSSSRGTLYYDGNAVAVNDTFSFSRANRLTFTSKSSTGTATFTYKISDTSASSSYSSSTGTVTIYVGNASPKVTAFNISVSNQKTYTFTKSIFEENYSDSDNDPIGKIRITSLPNSSSGTLRYDGSAISADFEFNASDAAKLTFRPTSSYTGSANFSWCASDGKEFSGTVRCNITVNDRDVVPTVSDGTVSVIQDKTYDFSQSDFTSLFRQADDNSLSYITITSLPSSGSLQLNGRSVSRNQEISRSNLSSLTFTPTSRYTGTVSFNFTASDGNGTSAVATMSIIVISSSQESSSVPVIETFKAESELVYTRNVRLRILSYDSVYGAPSQMAFAVNDGSFSNWISYQGSYDYQLPNDEGFYTIKVKVRNNANKESAVQTLMVRYDRTLPEIICAAISEDRRTISVVYSKSITTDQTNSGLRSYIRFGTSGSARQNLGTNDSASIDGATLNITLSSALSSNYNTVYIAEDALNDRHGNQIDREDYGELQPAAEFEIGNYSSAYGNGWVIMEEARPVSGKLSTIVDPIAMRDIISSAGLSDGRLVFDLPARSGTATSREITLPGDVLLSSANRRRIAEVGLTDGEATVYVSTDWLYGSVLDSGAPITLTLIENSSSSYQRSYTVSLASGAFELPFYDMVTLSIPYAANDPLTAVMFSDSTRSPLYSSRYEEGVVTANVRVGGTYYATQNSLTFPDVPQDHWAFTYIRGLSAKAIIEGMGNGRFEPEGKLTRAQFIKVLVTSLDLMKDGAVCGFSDVVGNDWHYEYIASAVSAGIITTNSGKFNPDEAITREDMCLFAYRAAAPAGFTYSQRASGITFSDYATINSGARQAVDVLTRAGIINGYPDGTFKPYGTSARSEVSKLIELIIDVRY